MKKLGLFVVVVASLYFFLPVNTTLSFLTSEKSYMAPISLGTNEDIFQTGTQSIRLETIVKKDISIKKEKQSDGSTKESQQAKTSVSLGSQLIIFVPQRPSLTLEASNITIEGLPLGAVQVEAAKLPESADPVNGFVFRISQTMKSAEFASSTRKGELHIRALGGFYHSSIPLTLVTQYNEATTVEEVEPPAPPSGDTNPPSDDTKPPSDDTKPPSDDTKPPSDDAKPPSDDTKPPSDDTNPPSDDTKPPSDDTKPPSDEAQPATSSLAVSHSAAHKQPHANVSAVPTATSVSGSQLSDSATMEEVIVQEMIPSVISRISNIVQSQSNQEGAMVPLP